MKNFFAFIFILIIFSSLLLAQNSHTEILKAVETRNYADAAARLEAMQKSEPKTFAANNYDYLLARIAEKQGDLARAAANYQTVVKRNSVLSEYALKRLAQIARSSGNLLLERIYLRQMSALPPESLLKNAAEARSARSFFESEDYAQAISALQNIQSPSPANPKIAVVVPAQPNRAIFGNLTGNDAVTRENSVYLAQAFLRSGKTAEAREIFTKLVNNLPNSAQPDDYALAGAKGLDELDGGRENFGKTAPTVPDTEHLRRALIYQFNRSFPLARLHYQAIVKDFPQSPNVADALYQIGRGYVLEGNFNLAIPFFERVQAEFPDNPLAKDALAQTASAYSRVNKPKEAVSRYKLFIEKYPDAENSDRAYLNIIDILRDTGEDTDAFTQAQKTREKFKGKLAEAVALFAQVRIRMSQNDWANALDLLNELENLPDLGGIRAPGATNEKEVQFLRGYALEQLKNYAEAVDVYLSIPDGRAEYYGWKATERLRKSAKDPVAEQVILQKLNSLRINANQPVNAQNAEAVRQAAQSAIRLTAEPNLQKEFLEKIRQAYALLPAYQKIPSFKLQQFGRKEILKESRPPTGNYHQNIADELLFLGLYDEAAPELAATSRQTSAAAPPASNDYAYTLATFYKRGDMANRTVAFIEPLWKNIPADYQIELIPRNQAELLFPAPYVDALLRYAPERNVDVRFVLSIMRQESRYRADVKSYAAARGLMQFISDTSNKIAADLNRTNFNQDELYNPPTAILFGSQYLANLFKQFPNQLQAVAASYNGGENNMARWMARSKTDIPERYVPEILFTQSKDYVYKVMANYRVYCYLYDEKLNAIR